MKTYILINKQTENIQPYKTLSALLKDTTHNQLGVSESTLRKWTWDASTDWKYSNDKIEILEKYAKGMAEVILAQLAIAIYESGIDVSVRAIGEVESKGFVFIYRKGLVLKDRSKLFDSIESVLSFLS